MSNKKQTVVEELAIALYENGFLQGNGDEIQKLMDRAKEKEKLRMILFACDVHMDIKKDRVKSLMELVEEMYNKTYGGNK
jgi:hypothetical protein